MYLIQFFFKLSTGQFFEMFPRHNGVATSSESFALNLCISLPLTNANSPLQCKLKQNFLLSSVKLIQCIFSAHSLCSNPCVVPLPKIKISFLLFSIFVEELISTPKITRFLLSPVPGNEKLPCLSNLIPYPKYLYLSISAFLVKVTAPNRQFSSGR